MTEQEFLEQFDKGEEFTEKELQNICFDFEEADVIEGEDGRWETYMETIVRAGDRFFSISWQRGLTECQESYWVDQPVEVDKHEYQKTVTVKEWIPVKEGKQS